MALRITRDMMTLEIDNRVSFRLWRHRLLISYPHPSAIATSEDPLRIVMLLVCLTVDPAPRLGVVDERSMRDRFPCAVL
jgi:hypothetical protein